MVVFFGWRRSCSPAASALVSCSRRGTTSPDTWRSMSPLVSAAQYESCDPDSFFAISGQIFATSGLRIFYDVRCPNSCHIRIPNCCLIRIPVLPYPDSEFLPYCTWIPNFCHIRTFFATDIFGFRNLQNPDFIFASFCSSWLSSYAYRYSFFSYSSSALTFSS